MQDVVAHYLSVVVVRADSAPHRLRELPDDVREEFAGIAEDARSSLTEMRRVLRLLREDPPDQASTHDQADAPDQPTTRDQADEPDQVRWPRVGSGLTPQPGLAELEALVATTRRAGADVRLEVDATTGAEDPAVEVTAYRVVQEAISNAVRHAPKAIVQLAVRQVGGELRLTVANGPVPAGGCPVPPASGSGHGLIGMRERIGLLDGTFEAGPTAAGGYLVEAAIPLVEEEPR